MKTDFLIIGGGIAGLSAAIHLAKDGADVTLLEEGSYPYHKICGEFISPEALPLLEQWGIPTAAAISKAVFVLPHRRWTMELPQQAATQTRYVLDRSLADRAQTCGACVRTGAKVAQIELGSPYRVHLTTGEVWESPVIMLSTGRLLSALTGLQPPPFSYVGVKAHFEGISLPQETRMHLFPGAYFGMVPIAEQQINIAGLIACSHEQAASPQSVLKAFLAKNSLLTETLDAGRCLFDQWMCGPVPEFGVRAMPRWPNAYFLGDAAGVIPPATGNGLAMGLTTGCMAARYALQGDPEGYRVQWERIYGRRIRRGMWLHRAFLSPAWGSLLTALPFLPRYIFRKTRG